MLKQGPPFSIIVEGLAALMHCATLLAFAKGLQCVDKHQLPEKHDSDYTLLSLPCSSSMKIPMQIVATSQIP